MAISKNRRNAANDPAAKTRVIVGGLLLALAWLLAAATVIALVVFLPDHHVRDYAVYIILSGIFVAGAATWAIVSDVM